MFVVVGRCLQALVETPPLLLLLKDRIMCIFLWFLGGFTWWYWALFGRSFCDVFDFCDFCVIFCRIRVDSHSRNGPSSPHVFIFCSFITKYINIQQNVKHIHQYVQNMLCCLCTVAKRYIHIRLACWHESFFMVAELGCPSNNITKCTKYTSKCTTYVLLPLCRGKTIYTH